MAEATGGGDAIGEATGCDAIGGLGGGDAIGAGGTGALGAETMGGTLELDPLPSEGPNEGDDTGVGGGGVNTDPESPEDESDEPFLPALID